MNRLLVSLSVIVGLGGPGVPPAHGDSVNVGISIALPAPPVIALPSIPALVVVPGTPVYYAPDLSVNFFAYGGRYYTHHEGAWFVASTHRGPWAFVPVERVPRPVLGVPVKYYKVPPGHHKVPPGHNKGGDGPPGHAKPGGGPPGHVKGPKR